jgi:hypothetical protein
MAISLKTMMFCLLFRSLLLPAKAAAHDALLASVKLSCVRHMAAESRRKVAVVD